MIWAKAWIVEYFDLKPNCFGYKLLNVEKKLSNLAITTFSSNLLSTRSVENDR